MNPETPTLTPEQIKEKMEVPEVKPKSGNWLAVFSMAAFVLLALGTVTFLYYQNQQLKKIVANYQSPASSPTPTATTDPTANWKTYTNMQMGISIKTPPNWFTHKEQKTLYGFSTNISYPVDNISSQDFIKDQTANISIGLTINNKASLNKIAQERINMPYSYLNNEVINFKVDGEDAVILNNKSGDGKDVLINHVNDYYILSLFNPNKIKEISTTFDQILSTFKFLDQSSANPTVTIPTANSKVSSPLTITGTVPSGWMFEGSFPIKLVDSDRNLIAQGSAKEVNPGSWQSSKPVAFFVTLPFSTTDASGYIVLMNDNPSGDPINSKSFEVPVKF